jgi:carbon-monoxide dehydrogenase medium subunit
MKPAPFQYHAPKTVEEALELLAEYADDDGRVLAGGQSLVPTMAFRLARPRHLVDINGVKELDYIEVAHHPIRARGTFCGSIAHADPASEWCAVAAALDAEMVVESKRSGLRVVPAKDFFKGIMTTALREDELLTEVRLPIQPPDSRLGFAEFSRRAGDYAIAMAVGAFRLKSGMMTEIRIAIGGAEAAPRRMTEAEHALIGRPPNAGSFQAAAHAVIKAIDPLDDENVSADYRRGLVRAMVTRALESASA